jgi:hypothetical protein
MKLISQVAHHSGSWCMALPMKLEHALAYLRSVEGDLCCWSPTSDQRPGAFDARP